MWDGVVGRLSALFERDRFEQELDEELRFHLEMETSISFSKWTEAFRPSGS